MAGRGQEEAAESLRIPATYVTLEYVTLEYVTLDLLSEVKVGRGFTR